jgi:hypothetical protein
MNPNSQYYLSFNMGYPNAYDRAWGRTGAELMIHGDCSSRGCYAMTDEQIAEIYALGREAFFGGQRAFQVQAYPFRMTPENMAKHRSNPNMAFWKMLKRGSDHFEVTQREPKVSVCEKRYVFDAQAPGNASTPLAFNPAGKCPVFEVPEDIVAAVNDKQRRDEFQTAELVTRGAKTSPIRMGTDGGMHPVFLAALQKQQPGSADSPLQTLAMGKTPGTIPDHVVPPRAPQLGVQPSIANIVATAQPAPPPAPVRVATTTERPAPSTPARHPTLSNLLSNISTPSTRRAAAAANETTGTITPTRPAAAQKPPSVIRSAQAAVARAIRPKPANATEPTAKTADAAQPANTAGLLSGAAPMLPAGSFESRWSAINGGGRLSQ